MDCYSHFLVYFIDDRLKFPLRSIEMSYNNYRTVRKVVKIHYKMIKMVFLCLKNSLESRYLPFKSLVIAWIKSEIDWRGENVQNFIKIDQKGL